MDPNKILEEMLALAKRLQHAPRGSAARELADKAISLDNWMIRGGATPARWCVS